MPCRRPRRCWLDSAVRLPGSCVPTAPTSTSPLTVPVVVDLELHECALRTALNGIPLVLARAGRRPRASGTSVTDLGQRLDRRLRAPHRRLPHGAAPAERTLQATFDWSFELLSPAEQMTRMALSVFTGSFELEAAEAVWINLAALKLGDENSQTAAALPEEDLAICQKLDLPVDLTLACCVLADITHCSKALSRKSSYSRCGRMAHSSPPNGEKTVVFSKTSEPARLLTLAGVGEGRRTWRRPVTCNG